MILLSILLALLFAVFLVAVFRLPNKPSALLAGYLFFFMHILAAGLVANSLQRLASPAVYLLAQTLFVLAAAGAWLGLGRPPLAGPFVGAWADLRRLRWKSVPELWLLGGGVAAAYAVSGWLVWQVPPNNNDSLSTHLSRIGFWLQHGSFAPWPIVNTKEVFYPINAALQVYWTVLFTHSDRLAGYAQWFGALATIVAVFGIARLLKASRPAAAFAALVWASFPIVLLQSSTTQLDLIAGAIFLPVVYFLILGLQHRRASLVGLSGLALGLALGTKQTLLFMMPGLGLFALLQGRTWRTQPRLLQTWVATTVIFFLLLSSPIYLLNMRAYGNPFGPPETVASSVGVDSGGTPAERLYLNVPRLLYQAVDFSGLPQPYMAIASRGKAKAVRIVAGWIGYPIEGPAALAAGHRFDLRWRPPLNEDGVWFGFLGALLLMPAALWQGLRGLRQHVPLRTGLALLAISILPVDALLRPGWDPFQGRYFLPAAGAAAPLMVAWWRDRPGFAWLRRVSAVLAVIIMVTVLLGNQAKPLSNPKVDLLHADRSALQTLQNNAMRGYVDMLDESLPEDAVVGFYSKEYLWDYPLFGEHFTRPVIPIVSEEQLGDMAWLKAQGIQFVLVNVAGGMPETITPMLIPYDEVRNAWMLYTWSIYAQ